MVGYASIKYIDKDIYIYIYIYIYIMFIKTIVYNVYLFKIKVNLVQPILA